MKEQTRTQKITVTTLAGSGSPGYIDGSVSTASFNSPFDIAVSPEGTIYVADAFNGSIRKISAGLVFTFAGNVSRDTSNGRGSAAGFFTPSRLAFDKAGNLYTLDATDARIRKISPQADVSTYAGTVKPGFSDGPINNAQFAQSFGLVIDDDGIIYLSDSKNRRVRRIAGEVSTLAGTGAKGFVNGEGNKAEFSYPAGIVLDKHGNLFVADQVRIRKISRDGIVTTFTGSGVQGFRDGDASTAQFTVVQDMVMDGAGNIYVTDNNRIRKILPDGSVTTIAGNNAGYKDGEGETAQFNAPQGLAIDAQGNIYVADFNNHRIRKISIEN